MSSAVSAYPGNTPSDNIPIPPTAVLVSDPQIPARGVYIDGNEVIKVHRHDIATTRPCGSLQTEFNLLKHCQQIGISGVAQPLSCDCTEAATITRYERVDGEDLQTQSHAFFRTVVMLLQVACILARLSMHGIAHNDIMPRNVVRTKKGRAVIIDFEWATIVTRRQAFYCNFFKRLRSHDAGFYGSWIGLCKHIWLAHKPRCSRDSANATDRA